MSRKEVEGKIKAEGETGCVPPDAIFISRVSYVQLLGTLSLFFRRYEPLPPGAMNAAFGRTSGVIDPALSAMGATRHHKPTSFVIVYTPVFSQPLRVQTMDANPQ